MEHYHRHPPFPLFSPEALKRCSGLLNRRGRSVTCRGDSFPLKVEAASRRFSPTSMRRDAASTFPDIGRGVTVSTSRCGRDGAGATPVGQSPRPSGDRNTTLLEKRSGGALACNATPSRIFPAVRRRVLVDALSFPVHGRRGRGRQSDPPLRSPEPRRRVFHETGSHRALNVSTGTDTETSTPGRTGLHSWSGPVSLRTMGRTCHPSFAFPFSSFPLLLKSP